MSSARSSTGRCAIAWETAKAQTREVSKMTDSCESGCARCCGACLPAVSKIAYAICQAVEKDKTGYNADPYEMQDPMHVGKYRNIDQESDSPEGTQESDDACEAVGQCDGKSFMVVTCLPVKLGACTYGFFRGLANPNNPLVNNAAESGPARQSMA